MDSLFKDYPIGAVLLWRTKERLLNERNLGHFFLPEPTKDYPVDYVLDGQQRLTSIFSVFQTELIPKDFLQKELHLYSLSYIPYPAMIVSLVKFFGTDKIGGQLYNDKQRKQLIKWFWKSCFSRRYSSGVNNAHQTDLNAMKKLRENEDTDISSFKCDISESFFTDNQFNINSVNTKTFIALLASKTPRSFISGAKVDLATTLKLSSSKEFHHIFPDKYLQRLGRERRDIYQLANFCFLNNADNQKIKDKAPDEYAKYINPESVSEVLCAAICPENTFELSYDEFIDKRKKMLKDYAKSLID